MPETETLSGLLGGSDILRDRINIIDPGLFHEILPDAARPLLASGDLRPFFRLMPPNVKYFLRSIAIAPLTCDGRLIGSLNHGDASPDRYGSGMETALLDHLARTVSEQLSRLLLPQRPGIAGKVG
jgi:GAF domain-containing protein